MILKDLNELAIIAKKKCESYKEEEIIFSDNFKAKFKEISYDEIQFHKYTSVVKTKGNLKIFIPNQWFIIASFFSDYLSALITYKAIAEELKVLHDATNFRDTHGIDEGTEKTIESYFKDPQDIRRFKQFLTNYSWWFGSKTIDRGDYFVSPVLNLAGVVNVTQTYIADIAHVLSKNPNLIEIINHDFNTIISHQTLDNEEIVRVSTKNLNDFAFQSFKFLIDKFGFQKITSQRVLKDSNINGQEYEGIKLKNAFGSNNLIGIFEEEQNKESLKSSGVLRYFDENLNIDNYPFSYFTTQWSDNDTDGLTFKSLEKFITEITEGKFKASKNSNIYSLIEVIINNPITIQKIYYGAPGTGKSYKIESILEDIGEDQKERITFHPEYDYSCFVGGYKPSSDTTGNIQYKFIPQVFIKIYIDAWKNPFKDYYLAIEEINRGNCAEIFGDLFQLLDRNSNYSISPAKELREYLEQELISDGKEGILDGKMKLPRNLHILASMNTSDQSLFPMDSAFKRRWSWEYVPINYEPKNEDDSQNESFNYIVKIDDQRSFKWIEFIESVNFQIKSNRNLGSDKCIGNYFIKPESNEISFEEFINKAIFYLWIDVFKDEEESIFSAIDENISYEDFFPIKSKGVENIVKLLSEAILDVEINEFTTEEEASQ